MLILKRERHLIAQHPAKPTSQIAIPQLSQVAQHRAIALGKAPTPGLKNRATKTQSGFPSAGGPSDINQQVLPKPLRYFGEQHE